MVFEFGVSNPRFKHQILLEDGFRILENRRFFRTCALITYDSATKGCIREAFDFCQATDASFCWALAQHPHLF